MRVGMGILLQIYGLWNLMRLHPWQVVITLEQMVMYFVRCSPELVNGHASLLAKGLTRYINSDLCQLRQFRPDTSSGRHWGMALTRIWTPYDTNEVVFSGTRNQRGLQVCILLKLQGHVPGSQK